MNNYVFATPVDFGVGLTHESGEGEEDGTIIFNVNTGGGAPYEGRLLDSSGDEFRTWQSGTTFSGLPPGKYFIEVKSNTDNGRGPVKLVAIETFVPEPV
jgi:hypothetical protein